MCGFTPRNRSAAAASFGRHVRRVEHLTLEIGLVDGIEFDQAERPHSGRGQVQAERRAQPAEPDHGDPRRLQPLLSGDTDLRQQQVPAVAPKLVGIETRIHSFILAVTEEQPWTTACEPVTHASLPASM